MKTNLQQWLKLQSEGKIQQTRPDEWWKRLLSRGYSIVLLVMLAIMGYLIAKLKGKFDLKTFIPHMIMGSLMGWGWGASILYYDPNYPAWMIHPWGMIGIDWIMTIEDWLFYPVSGGLFYCIYLFVTGSNKPHETLKWAVQIAHIGLTVFWLALGSYGGVSCATWFAIPAIIIFFLTWHDWDVVRYLKMSVVVALVFCALWDVTMVSLVSMIAGLESCSSWIYVTFDAAGVAYHSKAFLDYNTHGWAWIFNNPIEITIWFGITGAMYTYASLQLIRWLRKG